jgi:predicted nucleotidyltransferase
MTHLKQPDHSRLKEIIQRIVDCANPDQIILFGSAARGEGGPDSDLDLLIVKSGVTHRRQLAQQIHLSLFGIGIPVDVVVVTPEDVEAYADKVGSIIGPAIREGIQVYAA